MDNSLKNLEVQENIQLINESNKNNIIGNFNKNSFKEDKPTSLKFQHFEKFIKKISDNQKVDTFQENNNSNKFDYENYIAGKKFTSNFREYNSSSNINENNKQKNKSNYLKTYYSIQKSINFENKSNNKPLFTTFKDTKNKKNNSLKNKILNKEKLQKIELNKMQDINKTNYNKLYLKSKTPCQTFLCENNFDKSRNKSNLFLHKLNSQNSEGYLGRKELNGIPFTFESIMVHNNIYSNKSEKKRHEIILDDFIKLRQYIERQPQNKLKFIKEFLNKYYIEHEKYSKEKLISLCDFICYYDKNTISSFLKPYLDIKNMISDLLNNIDEINNILKNKNDEKYNEIKEELKDDINYIGAYRYSSPNIIKDNLSCNKENYKIKYYIKENFRKKKYNNRYDNELIKDEKELKDIKIKLRDLEHQKNCIFPIKIINLGMI